MQYTAYCTIWSSNLSASAPQKEWTRNMPDELMKWFRKTCMKRENDAFEKCTPFTSNVEVWHEMYTWSFFLLFWMVLGIMSRTNVLLAILGLLGRILVIFFHWHNYYFSAFLEDRQHLLLQCLFLFCKY